MDPYYRSLFSAVRKEILFHHRSWCKINQIIGLVIGLNRRWLIGRLVNIHLLFISIIIKKLQLPAIPQIQLSSQSQSHQV